ncbi:MAG: hypothetical protein AB7V43_18865 [Acidimicrobiia bacterium]
MGLARGRARHAATAALLAVVVAACSAEGSEGSQLLTPKLGLPRGVVAEELTLDAPFTLEVAPTVSGPGGIFSVWTKGETAGSWMGTIDATIDHEVDGTWRTLWVISENDHPGAPVRVDGDSALRETLGVGVRLDQQLLFSVPGDVPSGIYRVCRRYVLPAPDDKQAYVCAPLTIET